MFGKILSIFFALFFLNNSYAASFDCNKANSVTENIICSDLNISSLDEQMARKYKSALALGSENIKKEQREWLKEVRECKNNFCLRRLYEERVKSLDEFINAAMRQQQVEGQNNLIATTPAQKTPQASQAKQAVDNSAEALARCSAVLSIASMEMAKQGEQKTMNSFLEASKNLKIFANSALPYSEKAINSFSESETITLLGMKKQWKTQDYMDALTSKVSSCQQIYISEATKTKK